MVPADCSTQCGLMTWRWYWLTFIHEWQKHIFQQDKLMTWLKQTIIWPIYKCKYINNTKKEGWHIKGSHFFKLKSDCEIVIIIHISVLKQIYFNVQCYAAILQKWHSLFVNCQMFSFKIIIIITVYTIGGCKVLFSICCGSRWDREGWGSSLVVWDFLVLNRSLRHPFFSFLSLHRIYSSL